MKKILLLILLIGFIGCKKSKSSYDGVSWIKKSKLIEVFRASKSDYPNISVHRGGKGIKGYPENCLETLQYVSDSISAIFEIDVAQTKDGKLILMHDNSIDRTTNGSGSVKNLTYDELRRYYLVDDFGNKTNYKVPLFSEVLKWCKANDIILTIDVKRTVVSVSSVISAIEYANAEDHCIIITYDVEQAELAHRLAPDVLLSVSARNHEEFDRLLKTEIPTENMLAFTGTRLSDKSLYQRLHNEDIVCILGTLGNLDKQAEARGDELYLRWKKLGVDILATDRPFEAYKAID